MYLDRRTLLTLLQKQRGSLKKKAHPKTDTAKSYASARLRCTGPNVHTKMGNGGHVRSATDVDNVGARSGCQDIQEWIGADRQQNRAAQAARVR